MARTMVQSMGRSMARTMSTRVCMADDLIDTEVFLFMFILKAHYFPISKQKALIPCCLKIAMPLRTPNISKLHKHKNTFEKSLKKKFFDEFFEDFYDGP